MTETQKIATTPDNANVKLQQLLNIDSDRQRKAGKNFTSETVQQTHVPEVPLEKVADGLISASYMENPIMNRSDLGLGSGARSMVMSHMNNQTLPKYSMPAAHIAKNNLNVTIPAEVRQPPVSEPMPESDRRVLLTALLGKDLAKKVRVLGMQSGLGHNIASSLGQRLYPMLYADDIELPDASNYPEWEPVDENVKKALLLLFSAHLYRPLETHAQAKNIEIKAFLEILVRRVLQEKDRPGDIIQTEIEDEDMAEILS